MKDKRREALFIGQSLLKVNYCLASPESVPKEVTEGIIVVARRGVEPYGWVKRVFWQLFVRKYERKNPFYFL